MWRPEVLLRGQEGAGPTPAQSPEHQTRIEPQDQVLCAHFTDEETEVQVGGRTYPGPQSWLAGDGAKTALGVCEGQPSLPRVWDSV